MGVECLKRLQNTKIFKNQALVFLQVRYNAVPSSLAF